LAFQGWTSLFFLFPLSTLGQAWLWLCLSLRTLCRNIQNLSLTSLYYTTIFVDILYDSCRYAYCNKNSVSLLHCFRAGCCTLYMHKFRAGHNLHSVEWKTIALRVSMCSFPTMVLTGQHFGCTL
jgi:hypothetical protein